MGTAVSTRTQLEPIIQMTTEGTTSVIAARNDDKGCNIRPTREHTHDKDRSANANARRREYGRNGTYVRKSARNKRQSTRHGELAGMRDMRGRTITPR